MLHPFITGLSLLVYLSLVLRPVFTETLHFLYHELSHTRYLHHHHEHDAHHYDREEEIPAGPDSEEKSAHGHNHNSVVDYLLHAQDLSLKRDLHHHSHSEYTGTVPLHNYSKQIKRKTATERKFVFHTGHNSLEHQIHLKPPTPPPQFFPLI